jgi:hypothetical protein
MAACSFSSSRLWPSTSARSASEVAATRWSYQSTGLELLHDRDDRPSGDRRRRQGDRVRAGSRCFRPSRVLPSFRARTRGPAPFPAELVGCRTSQVPESDKDAGVGGRWISSGRATGRARAAGPAGRRPDGPGRRGWPTTSAGVRRPEPASTRVPTMLRTIWWQKALASISNRSRPSPSGSQRAEITRRVSEAGAAPSTRSRGLTFLARQNDEKSCSRAADRRPGAAGSGRAAARRARSCGRGTGRAPIG